MEPLPLNELLLITNKSGSKIVCYATRRYGVLEGYLRGYQILIVAVDPNLLDPVAWNIGNSMGVVGLDAPWERFDEKNLPLLLAWPLQWPLLEDLLRGA